MHGGAGGGVGGPVKGGPTDPWEVGTLDPVVKNLIFSLFLRYVCISWLHGKEATFPNKLFNTKSIFKNKLFSNTCSFSYKFLNNSNLYNVPL